MHTLSSARRTCMASASAVECTATVRMPISRQARWMRSAISPRLAIRTFSNIGARRLLWLRRSGHDHQDIAKFDGPAVAEEDLLDRAGVGRRDRVHHLHRFNDQQRLSLLYPVTDFDEGVAAG